MTAQMATRAPLLSFLCAVVPTITLLGCTQPLVAPMGLTLEASASEPEQAHAGPYSGYTLYVEPNNNARRQAEIWRHTDPEGAAIMDDLATAPQAIWLGDWMPDVASVVNDALNRAGDQLQVFVVYNIPHRDCGFYSAGGAQNAQQYADFVQGVANGLAGRLAIVVLEPDALSLVHCLDEQGEAERKQMMSNAVDTLTAAGGKVYLDAGDSNWIPSADMAAQLLDAGVQRAAGFALNVSHTEFTENEIVYAEEIRAIVGEGAHYIIDTSRNGRGPSPDNEWCNPLGRANGERPTLQTGFEGLDALLWIKPPGESDGDCNGGPPAGHWWPEYARDLAKARAADLNGGY